MLIFIGADHRGFNLKERIKDYLKNQGYEVMDLGAQSLNPDDDYTYFAQAVAEKVSAEPDNSRGILICGSGVGVDGSGWLPVDFAAISYAVPLKELKTDPINNGKYFYSYACDTTRSTYELNAVLESDSEQMKNDGGNNTNIYETGTDLNILP